MMDRTTYTRRVLIALGLAAGMVVLLIFLTEVSGVLLLLFAAILGAVFLNAGATRLAAHTPLPYRWAVALTALAGLVVLVGIGWWIGPRLEDQLDRLSTELPQALDQVKSWLEQYTWGRALVNGTPSPESMASSGADIFGRITGMVSSALSALGNVLLVLLVGFYLAFEADLYVDGLVRLVPPRRRDRAREVLAALRRGLGWWLVGRFTGMAIVGVLTALGLWIVGVPLALSLGLIAALLSFIPMIGSIASFVPMALVGLMVSPTMALYALGVGAGVQLLESNLITPVVQKYAVSMPPALLLGAQLLMGVLFGLLGILLAAPLMVVVVILVQLLYVEDVLGEEVNVMGDKS